MIATIAVFIGILLFGSGLFYALRAKGDKEMKNIGLITTVVGMVIGAGGIWCIMGNM